MKSNIPMLMDDGESLDKENFVSSAKQVKNIYHLWLIDEIKEAKWYLKWFDVLQNAGEDDLVIIHVNSPGGLLDTSVQLVTQIRTSEAQVVCQIESACCSGATMIALACSGLICYPHSYMMIHTSSGCSFGKQSDIKRQEDFYNVWIENFFYDIYKDFLNEKEIESVLNGNDIWLNSDEVMARFKHRIDLVNKENAKSHKKEQEYNRKISSFIETLKNSEEEKEKKQSAQDKKTKKGISKKQKSSKPVSSEQNENK